MKRTLYLAALLVPILHGQTPPLNEPMTFTLGSTVTGSAAVETLTWPANSSQILKLSTVQVLCPANCTISIELSANQATATLVTPVPLRNRVDKSGALAYTSSNISSAGAQVLTPYTCSASVSCSIDLSQIALAKNYSKLQSVTLRSSNTTGTSTMQLTWQEADQ
jgi:hypothetical protein